MVCAGVSQGLLRILKKGDMVWAYDEESGKSDWKEVKQLFRGETKEWATIIVNGEKITSTPGHKYYLPENDGCREINEQHEHASYDGLSIKWVSAKNLKQGDKVLLADGKYGIVEKVEVKELDEAETTYNFEVEGDHTYHVGESSVCVHNRKYDAQIAKELGFKPTKYISHGQRVYQHKKKNLFISRDVDTHIGGNWKMADSVKSLGSKNTRMGTYKTVF